MPLSKVTIWGLLLWCLIFVFSNLTVVHNVGFLPILYIIVCYLSLMLGFVYSRNKPPPKNFIFNRKSLFIVLYGTILIALLALCFRLVDKFYIRGINLNNSTIVNRLILTKNPSSVFGIVGAFLSPFAFFPLFIFLVLKLKNKLILAISLIIFLNPIFENIILGARFGILLVLVLLVLILFHFKKIRISFFRGFVFTFLAIIMCLIATKMFLERTKEFAITDKTAINHILTNAGYNFTIKPNKAYRDAVIKTDTELLKLGKLAKVNIAQYYTHGIFEFNYLYENHDKPFRAGAYMFSIVPKLSNTLFKTEFNLKEISNSMSRTGVYTSFFGPLYIDFGWFGPVFMFFFGLLQSIIYNKVLVGNFKYIPLLLYFMIIDFFMPVVNFIVSAQGLYIIIAFSVFIIYYKFIMFKKAVKKRSGDL